MSMDTSMEYKGCTITAMPRLHQGRFNCRVSISKLEDGVPKGKTYKLESDFTNLDDAIAFCIRSGKEIIDRDGTCT